MEKNNFKYFYILMIFLVGLINGCSICKPKYPSFVDECDEKNDPKCYKLYADLHFCKKQEKQYKLTYSDRTFYLGDFHDMKHAEVKMECRKD